MDFKEFQNGYMDGLHEAARRDGLLQDGHFYELAMEQLQTGQRDENLWAACLAHCEFQHKPAQAMYVRRMAKALKEHHLRKLEEKERQEHEQWVDTQRRIQQRREEKQHEKELEEEREKERHRLHEASEREYRKQVEDWRAGRGEHPNKLKTGKWALWGGVIGLVLLFTSVGPWVGLACGAVSGWGVSKLLNYIVMKYQK